MERDRSPDPWPKADSEAALAEGWDVWDTGAKFVIQRDDDPDEGARAFASDRAAIEWVRKRAAAGSEMHARALRIHGTEAK